MPLRGKSPWYAPENRTRYLTFATVLVIVVAVLDWFTIPYLGLGYLYFFPLVMVSAFLSRWQILSLALVCAALQEMFAYLSPGPEKWPRIVLVYAVYAFAGLLTRDMVRHRRAATRQVIELNRDLAHPHDSEEQLRMLINSSPVAVITISADGNIALCNDAAHRIFGVGCGALVGRPVASLLPPFDDIQNTEGCGKALECHARRDNGDTFLAHLWVFKFSDIAPTLAAIIVDASEPPLLTPVPDGKS